MGDIDVDFLPDTPVSNAVKLKHKLDIHGLDQLITEPTIAIYIYIFFISYLFYLPHDYNNYKEMPKKMLEEMARRPKGNYRAYVN